MDLAGVQREIVAAVEAIAPSVAVVETVRARPKGRSSRSGTPAQASAVVYGPDGLLVTNQHVVEDAQEVRVALSNGRTLDAQVLGGDAGTDLAILRVDAGELPSARLGDSEQLRVGQFVLAVGNALGLPGGPTVSLGVVSALGRALPGSDFVFEGLLQTDAAINPGNSGGPLVDLSGAVVGINCSIAAFAQGVGFAIPIHAVRRIAAELARSGRVERPWVGVSVAEVGEALGRQHGLAVGSGLWVAEVVPRSPAHRAGLRPGDLLTRVGPFPVRRVRDLVGALAAFPVGSDVEVDYVRRRQSLSTLVPLGETPSVAAPP